MVREFKEFLLQTNALALAILGVGAASEVAAEGLQARLVNKRPVGEQGPVSFYVGQIEVTLPDGAKKLLPHWSYMEPQVVGERVFFLPTLGVKLTRVFIFDPKTDKTSTFRFPFDMNLYFGSPSFSPDGSKIALLPRGAVEAFEGDEHRPHPTGARRMRPCAWW